MELAEYYKRKKRVNLGRRFARYLILFTLLTSMIWGFFWLPYFRVSNIIVADADNESGVKKSILNYLVSMNKFFLPNNHFAFLSTTQIEAVLKETGFGLASAEKVFPNSLVIKFEKAEPLLMACKTQEECYYVGENGLVSARAPVFSELPLPQIRIENVSNLKLGDNVISTEDSAFIKKWIENLNTIDEHSSEIFFLKDGEMKIFLKEGWFIYLIKNSDPQKLFTDLKLLLDQKIKDSRSKLEYIDLRFENKAFYKLRSMVNN